MGRKQTGDELIAMYCKGPFSTSLKRAMLMWSFSWHYEGMKEDALQKAFLLPMKPLYESWLSPKKWRPRI
jgi:hypothetical protein